MAQPENHNRLVVRKRIRHGRRLYWIGRIGEHGFTFYGDICSPTGYGYKSKENAARVAREIERRLLARNDE